jgi:hypothetical protein
MRPCFLVWEHLMTESFERHVCFPPLGYGAAFRCPSSPPPTNENTGIFAGNFDYNGMGHHAMALGRGSRLRGSRDMGATATI